MTFFYATITAMLILSASGALPGNSHAWSGCKAAKTGAVCKLTTYQAATPEKAPPSGSYQYLVILINILKYKNTNKRFKFCRDFCGFRQNANL